MSELIEKLDEYGCDVETTLERFVGDEELYKLCLYEFLTDEGFKNLEKYIEIKDMENIFNEAHTLKGVILNLGLNPLYEKLSIIVEKLRNDKTQNVDLEYVEFIKELDRFEEVLKSIK